MAQRYRADQIVGLREGISSSPESELFGVGQLVFALRTDGSGTCIGQCVTGNNLIPWGLCCYFACGVNSACSCAGSVACGFALGSGTYLALGSVTGCGATLWRRIK